jgi:hypothetical protein
MSNSLRLWLTAACFCGSLAFAGEDKDTPGRAVRVEVHMKDVFQWETPSKRIRFFVQTDRTDVPMVCLADNAHFPAVERVLARERRIDGKGGVLVDVHFKEEVSPETQKKAALAINLWQPKLTKKSYPVYPTNGKKLRGSRETAKVEAETDK